MMIANFMEVSGSFYIMNLGENGSCVREIEDISPHFPFNYSIAEMRFFLSFFLKAM